MLKRIFEQPDGHLLITTFANKPFAGETEQEMMDRETQKLSHKNLPYYDIDSTTFPDEKLRNKWRMSADKKSVIIDNTLEIVQEVIETEINNLDTELAKQAPDPVQVIRIQRNIDKLKKEQLTWRARDKATKKIIS